MKRRQARENAILAVFEASFNANSIEEIIGVSREGGEYAVDAYGEALLINFYAHSAEVDDAITARLKDWSLARLPRVNAAILRMAVTEMMYSGEDMDSIVINEAVEIAKKYAGDEDYQFINGVLGSLSRELHPAQRTQAASKLAQEAVPCADESAFAPVVPNPLSAEPTKEAVLDGLATASALMATVSVEKPEDSLQPDAGNPIEPTTIISIEYQAPQQEA